MPETVALKVHSAESGQRLDRFLTRNLPGVSRAELQRCIRSGKVKVNQGRQKSSYLVRSADEIRIELPDTERRVQAAQPIPLQILYEDRSLAVIEKPAGLVVHPGAGQPDGTLVNALLYHFRNLPHTYPMRPGIVHRLDKDTSGLLVVAKQAPVQQSLMKQFKQRQVEKHYLALVYGQVVPLGGRIERAIGRDPWARTRISTRSRHPRPALTDYQTIHSYRDFTYLQVIPLTGRTHQIRVHLQSIGHPVVGDRLYARRQGRRKLNGSDIIESLGRHFLHASFLVFTHPETGERVSFESHLPEELAQFLSLLE